MADEGRKQQLRAARTHIEQHVQSIAMEMAEWQDTGVLRAGELRRAAAMIADPDALSLAEGLAIRECVKLCASHQPPAPLRPLSLQQIWDSTKIMSANAELGLFADQIVKLTRAVEATHGILGEAEHARQQEVQR